VELYLYMSYDTNGEPRYIYNQKRTTQTKFEKPSEKQFFPYPPIIFIVSPVTLAVWYPLGLGLVGFSDLRPLHRPLLTALAKPVPTSTHTHTHTPHSSPDPTSKYHSAPAFHFPPPNGQIFPLYSTAVRAYRGGGTSTRMIGLDHQQVLMSKMKTMSQYWMPWPLS
jgi:hypothetical protein